MSGNRTNEPKLVQAPPRRSPSKNRPGMRFSSPAAANTTTPPRNAAGVANNRPARPLLPAARATHEDPDRDLTAADAQEGTEAFRNRASEITSFKVVSRVRPFIKEELEEMNGQERRSVVEMLDNTTILLDPKDNWAPKAQFEFDASLWSIPPSHKLVHTFQDTRRATFASQRDVYNIIAKDLVPRVFDGYNSCILTYGQTGSGKTYTMMGHYNISAECGKDGEEGIIPRVSSDIFTILEQKQNAQPSATSDDSGAAPKISIEVSFVEIYMERVRDLLDPALRNTRGNEKLQDARIRQDPYSGPFVEGVTKYRVENWGQCCTLLERGSLHRTTCATAVHNQSSRSHAIFQITVIQERTVPAKDRFSLPTTKTQSGRINLVDLAGSERGGFQEYVKESAAINTSLLALRRVIDNLTERQNMLMEQARAEITGGYYQDRPLPQVPFRDSILTWLLSDSIGGNARTTMVATLSPLVRNYGDTLATLQWSSKARNLVTLVKVNNQTVVQGGMVNHVSELGAAVQIQRHNLDGLREALRSKQERAAAYERDARNLQRTLVKNNAHLDEVRRDAAAMTIQRAFHRLLFMKKLRSYQQHCQKLRAMQASHDQGTANAEKTRQSAEKAEAEAFTRLKAAQKETEAVATEVSTMEQGKETFRAQQQEAQAERERVLQQIDAEGLCRRRADEVDREVQSAKAALEAKRKEKASNEETILAFQAKIEESRGEQWSMRIKQDAEDLSGLRKRRDELKVQLEAAVATRDALRAKHAKLFKKKK